MKRKPTSRQWKTALYLRDVCGQHTFTARDIHDAMRDARAHYHSLIPASVIAERDRLFAEHDYAPTWDTTYIYQVYWMPALNTPLKNLFKPYMILADFDWQWNTTAAEISSAFKRGYIELVATKPYRTYRLNPAYIE